MLAINKKTGVIHHCHVWNGNGSHPKDNSTLTEMAGGCSYMTDGEIVRRGRMHRTPDDICKTCGVALYKHGEIINEVGGKLSVCPGDFIVEETVNGASHYISVSAGSFNSLYEEVKQNER